MLGQGSYGGGNYGIPGSLPGGYGGSGSYGGSSGNYGPPATGDQNQYGNLTQSLPSWLSNLFNPQTPAGTPTMPTASSGSIANNMQNGNAPAGSSFLQSIANWGAQHPVFAIGGGIVVGAVLYSAMKKHR